LGQFISRAEHAGDHGQDTLAELGNADLASGTGEDAGAELVLELGDSVRKAGLRDVTLLRCPAKRRQFRNALHESKVA